MITIIKIETLDEATYNNIYCPQCNNKIGFKPKDTKVHIFRLSQKISGKLESVGLTCKRCKNHYLVSSE